MSNLTSVKNFIDSFEMHGSAKTSSERQFGIVFSMFFLILSFFSFQGSNFITLTITLILSILFLFLAFFRPQALQALNRLWMKVGMFLGAIIHPILLSAFFFLAITPIGSIMRTSGALSFTKSFDRKKKSYWISKDEDFKPENMRNQF